MSIRLASRRSRAAVVAAAVFLGAGGLAIAELRSVYVAGQIKPLLPAPGSFSCFEGTFSETSVDIDDWSKAKKVMTGEKRPDGSDGYLIEFERTRDVSVTRFALRLDYDDRKADYDWIYNFALVGEVTGYGTLHARGECPWYESSSIETSWGVLSGSTHRLGCGIDCDGGSMSVARITGTDKLALSFGEYGLSMKLGCGGGGRFRVRENSRAQTFTLTPAPQTACRHFRRLD